MKKKGTFQRYEHEMIVTLLIILIVAVTALWILVRAQNEDIVDIQELLQELADEAFADLE